MILEKITLNGSFLTTILVSEIDRFIAYHKESFQSLAFFSWFFRKCQMSLDWLLQQRPQLTGLATRNPFKIMHGIREKLIHPFLTLCAVWRIHDILGWIRIRIRGSMPLACGSGFGFGSGSFYFHH
jgi:hypothetical protein